MFHLPHNAIIPEEVKFIVGLINSSKEYYLYDDLKAMMFEEEIRQHKFETFHPGMYKNFHLDSTLQEMYEDVLYGRQNYSDIKKLPYTAKKTLNGCWNEQARDYFEFMAFTGLMPSYYKGFSSDSEKRYYVGETLKAYKEGRISYSDILLKMKFRNASKNYDDMEQYNVRNRPFCVALRIFEIFKNKGYEYLDPATLSYYVKSIKNEDEIVPNDVHVIDTRQFSYNQKREIDRGSTFLRQHIQRGLGIGTVSSGNTYMYDLRDFSISRYNLKRKALFIGDYYVQEDIEITPKLIRSLQDPKSVVDRVYKNKLISLGMIDDEDTLVDFNIDTDLQDRNLVSQVITNNIPKVETTTLHVEKLDNFRMGKEVSESGNGIAYEEFLYSMLKQKFGESRVQHYGARSSGRRLSDIVCSLTVLNDDGNRVDIKVIIEAKSGGAIKSFDERKERDDILNTLKSYPVSSYAGIWYMVVDSNQIPEVSVTHGGYRGAENKLSFKQKLLQIQATIMQHTMKMSMVTAFSYVEFMRFLMSINYDSKNEYISKVQAPDFWTWSNKFIEDSYVTVRG